MKDLDREDEILDKMIPIIEHNSIETVDYFGGVIFGRKVDEWEIEGNRVKEHLSCVLMSLFWKFFNQNWYFGKLSIN